MFASDCYVIEFIRISLVLGFNSPTPAVIQQANFVSDSYKWRDDAQHGGESDGILISWLELTQRRRPARDRTTSNRWFLMGIDIADVCGLVVLLFDAENAALSVRVRT